MFTTKTSVGSPNRRVSTKLFGSRMVHPLVFVSVVCLLFASGYVPKIFAYPSSRLTPAKAFQQEVATLLPGATLEREIKGGEVRNFRVSLVRGQFMHVLVRQLGIDVVVTTFGPDGKHLFSTDSPNGRWGTEPVVFIPETSGDYRLEVRPANEKAPAARYEIKIAALREVKPADRDHVEAQRTFEEAETQRAQAKADSRRAAIEKYKLALSLFEKAGERAGQALTLYTLGFAHAELGEFRLTLEYTGQALPLFKGLGDDTMEGFSLNLIGSANDFLGELPKALEYLNQALVLFKKQENHSSEASVLNNLGRISYQNSDWQTALEKYSQALALFRLIKDRNREAIALHNLGVTYYSLGEQEKALDYFQQALLLGRAVGDKRREALALSEIGYIWNSSGEPQKALDYYNQALVLSQAAGDRNGQATTFDFMGIAYSVLGETEKALNYHQQALELKRAASNPREVATTLGNIGHVYSQLDQPQKALEYYSQALALFRALEDRNRVAVMLQGIALSERQLGKLFEARQRIEEALPLVEAVRAGTSSQQFRASYFASKQDAYALYIDILMRQHRQKPLAGHDAEALQASERARARSLVELLNEAHVDIRQGVDAALIERERSLMQRLNAKAQRQIQLLGQKSSQEQLAELVKEIRAIEDEYRQVRASIRSASPAYAALTQPQPLKLNEIQEQLDPNTLLLEYSLGEERSYLWLVSKSGLQSYELPARQQIDKHAREVYGLLTSRSAPVSGETASQKQKRLVAADERLPMVSAELSRMILGPVSAELEGKRLVIVADGALQFIPFAALPAPNKTATANDQYRALILDHEMISLPSASALAVQRKNLLQRKPAANAVAVIADPVFSLADIRFKERARNNGPRVEATNPANTRLLEHLAGEDGKLRIRRLPFTRQEADRILAVSPQTGNLKATDFKANRSIATGSELSKYRYVHFATHGYLDSERPDLSAIVLSLVDQNGKSQDGFLRAHEIYNLTLPAELVVLSACQTGLGKEIKGEGLVGLTQGFMYAGARRVVVSLWNVNDKATADLMQRFYSGMLKEKQSPSAALRKAQAEMSQQKQWQQPYYWAAFVLQGEWN